MVSKVVPSTSTVRHSDVPQTEQRRLLRRLHPAVPPWAFRDPDAVRLGGVGFERLLVYLSNLETWLNAQRMERLSFSIARCIS